MLDPDKGFVSIEFIRVGPYGQQRFECQMPHNATWMALYDEAILPGLRALGYVLDRSDLDVN